MEFARWLEVATGVLLGLIVFYDIFKSIVLPRPAIHKFIFIRWLFFNSWALWRWIGDKIDDQGRREGWLAVFAPIAALMMFLVWGATLILAYALIFDGLRDEMKPAPTDFLESVYFSATTLVPLSYGDVVPIGIADRIFAIAESATGVAIAALAITLLFSLYDSFQRREELVVQLDALAGAPPAGLQILETSSDLGMRDKLSQTFDEWRAWTAAVLESHLAYPLLFYFRSSHDNEAWLNSFGAVMDAANLVVSTIDGETYGPAKLMLTIGDHLVEDMAWNFGFDRDEEVGIEKSEFVAAVERLERAGYTTRSVDAAWEHFSRIRLKYAYVLNQAARRFAIIPATWISDRSYLPHRARPPLPLGTPAGRR
jgi:hypothetical protein